MNITKLRLTENGWLMRNGYLWYQWKFDIRSEIMKSSKNLQNAKTVIKTKLRFILC